ncbi:hypothetical protein Barb7_01351 [Bacteroidales bacterium Barb7]|nr:hypothetical protein Barb7_02650 [Bacteroidales bacterium Barb7]OAV75072.1 hypothetical protein Barb7_01351 [Bacteroidales bacterium Barb7]
MSGLKEIGTFLKNGSSAFCSASRGEYSGGSKAVREIRNEIMQAERSFSDDKKNLRMDKKNIERDTRKSFNKIALNNG